jgi:hypothetical protein
MMQRFKKIVDHTCDDGHMLSSTSMMDVRAK